MKKVASIVCLFFIAMSPIASYADTSESVSALKEKIAKLELQIKQDASYISAIRAENRELKKEIRKLKRAAVAGNVSTVAAAKETPKASSASQTEKSQNRRASSRVYKETVEASTQPKAVAPAEEPAPVKANNGVWDNIFPF